MPAGTRTALLATLVLLPAVASAQSVARIAITPASPRMVAGQSLQLRAQAVDAAGKPVSNAVIKFQQGGGQFEGVVSDSGLVSAGAVSTIPVTVSAIVPGEKPVISTVNVVVVPGPAATVSVEPRTVKLIAGQSLALHAKVLSAAGDTRNDPVAWSSSSAAVASVAEGVITATKAGTATITGSAGGVKGSVSVEVVPADVSTISITPSINSCPLRSRSWRRVVSPPR